MEKYNSAPDRDVRYVVTCNANSKGIHIRKVKGTAQVAIL